MGHPPNYMNDGTSNGTTYTYDAEGRLSAVSGSGSSAAYYYDPEGQRVESVVNGTVTTFGRDPQGRVVWRDLNQPYAQDIYLNGRHFGSLTTNGDANHTLNSVTYSMVDEVGTDREQFDGSQNALAKITSNPFGDNQITSGNTADSVFYTGKERDAESGLDYFGARYYGSNMGRFLSPDPSALYYADPTNPQSLNLYSYGLNNPLVNIDPTGLTCQTNSSDGSTYDDLDGNGCATVDQQNADRLKSGQYDAIAYGGANAATLEARDAVSQFALGGNKATISYLPQDPFTQNFQKSLGMQAILAKVKGNCSASSGNGGVGTGEAAVNSAIDHGIGQPSIAEDQLGAFTYSYSQQGGTLNVTVSNPITLNSLAYHSLASGSEDVNGNPGSNVLAGDTMAGSGLDRLGRLTGSVPFGRIDQQLQIKAANPCS